MTVLTYQEQLHCAKELEVKGTDNLVKEDGLKDAGRAPHKLNKAHNNRVALRTYLYFKKSKAGPGIWWKSYNLQGREVCQWFSHSPCMSVLLC